jgi:Inhibitor of vertebrate lysozyme (Ivy)
MQLPKTLRLSELSMRHLTMKLSAAVLPFLVASVSPAAAVAAGVDTLVNANVMKDAAFRAAYVQALGPLKREAWLIDMDGPGTQRLETVAGSRYLLVTTCKDHDCGANNMVVLYATAPPALYGEVWRGGRLTAIGNPPPRVALELKKIWNTEWPGH